MKYLLDTDHISILQLRSGPEYAALAARVAQHTADLAFSVIASWVSLEPPSRAKFGPAVTRLWPSESRPTPSIIALRRAADPEGFGMRQNYRAPG